MRPNPLPAAAALSALFVLGPGPLAAQERPDAVIRTNRDAAAVLETRDAKRGPTLAPDPFAWLRATGEPAATEWRLNERRQADRWLAADPNYAALVEAAARLPTEGDEVELAAGRLFARSEGGDAGWRSLPLSINRFKDADWRIEPALSATADHPGAGGARLMCEPRGQRGCLAVRRTAAGLALDAYDPATGRVSPSPFRLPPSPESAVPDGAGGLLVATREDGVSVLRRVSPGLEGGASPVLFRSAVGETLTPGFAFGADGKPVTWLTVTAADRPPVIWIESEQAFRRLSAPAGARIVGVVGDQLLLLLREGWAGVADLPAGSLIGLDLTPLLKRAPELTPHRVLSLVDVPDVRAAVATGSGLLLIVHEGASDQVYLCQPGLRGWAVRRLPDLSADRWEVAASDAAMDTVILRSRAFPQGESFVQVSTKTGVVAQALPDRAEFAGALTQMFQAGTLDQSKVEYMLLHGAHDRLPAALPVLLLASPWDAREAEVLRSLGALWLQRGGTLAIAARRSRRYDPENGYVNVLVGFEDLSSIARDLVARGTAPGGKVSLAGYRFSATLAAVDLIKHPSQWSSAVLIDPVTDPLRPASGAAPADWAASLSPAAALGGWATWRRIAPYDNIRAGAHYAPALLVATSAAAPAFATDGSRFTARLNDAGGAGLFVDAPDNAHASALAIAFLLRLAR